jgi:hypothetical protein
VRGERESVESSGEDRVEGTLPQVIGSSALGASLAAHEQWLRDEDADLMSLLDQAIGELAIGFDHHDSAPESSEAVAPARGPA